MAQSIPPLEFTEELRNEGAPRVGLRGTTRARAPHVPQRHSGRPGRKHRGANNAQKARKPDVWGTHTQIHLRTLRPGHPARPKGLILRGLGRQQ